uniref:ferroxidase n=2 Tax=Kalanchoe fedtschenkoi TaxID=63787 RepID=A0A7N0T1R5_KALFE
MPLLIAAFSRSSPSPPLHRAMAASKILFLKRISPAARFISFSQSSSSVSRIVLEGCTASNANVGSVLNQNIDPPQAFSRRPFSSDTDFQGPAPVNYHLLLPEDEYHRVADSTIQYLLEKFEEYGDSVQIDGFDIDYGNQVLTLKLGSSGTYVLNKQTPNRQLWLSSPVSGPSRFDWDKGTRAWIYRRTKANLFSLFETELEQLCGSPINLS